MNTKLLLSAYWLIRFFVKPSVFDPLAELVKSLIDRDMPGAEKKEMVVSKAMELLELHKGKFGAGWEIVIDLIIAVVRSRFELPEKV